MGTFAMPSLGADMEAGTLVEWLKQPGDELEHGDIIAVVETDKGAIEVEVFESGKLNELLVEPGSVVPVGTPLARIGVDTPPEVPAEPAAVTPEPRPFQRQPPISPAAAKVGVVPPAGIRASPAARNNAAVNIPTVKRGMDGMTIWRNPVAMFFVFPPAPNASSIGPMSAH